MNRMERLTGILLLLHDRGRSRNVTAEEIAAHYEVSRRTVLRDVQGLCEMGVPVVSQEGPGGGYGLPPEFALAPLPLTANESLLMLLALSALEKMADAPYAAERATLRAKLRTLVTPRQERAIERRLAALSFDVPRRSFEAPHLEALLHAAEDGSWVCADYRSARRLSTQRLLPRKLGASGGFWYCEAFSLEHGEERHYRADRFERVERIPAPADAPYDVSALPRVAYDDPSHPEIRILLTDEAVARAEREPDLGEHVVPLESGGALWVFRCPPSELDWYARYLLAFGAGVHVLAPPELRERIAATARAVAAQY